MKDELEFLACLVVGDYKVSAWLAAGNIFLVFLLSY